MRQGAALFSRIVALLFLLTLLEIQAFGARSQSRWWGTDSTPAEAEEFFHLPKWSQAYRPCESHPEISCAGLVRACNVVKAYVKKFGSGKLNRYVRVKVTSSLPVHCRMSSFYNAFLIAMFTNRNLVLESDESEVSWLRSEHVRRYRYSVNIVGDTKVLATNHTFSCNDIFTRANILELSGCMWPQIGYIHQNLAHRIRDVFGIHAAYYLGNYLFDVDVTGCDDVPAGAIGIVTQVGGRWKMTEQVMLEKSESCRNQLDTYIIIDIAEQDSASTTMCQMRRMIQTKQLVYPFSATIPWFAAAMQGTKAITAEVHGHNCIELSTSQSGSLIHTYNPDKAFHYVVNNDFFVCGTNFDAARLYIRDLLW